MDANRSKILLTGASGFVGQCISPRLAEQFELVKAPPYDEVSGEGLDLSDKSATEELIEDVRPNVVVHLAAIKNVGRCEREPDFAWAANVQTTRNLLAANSTSGPHMVFLSSDYVFDGKKGGYTELDRPQPATVYGQTKKEAELLVLAAGGTVVRSGGLYGPATRPGVLFSWALEQLKQGQSIEAFTNVFNSPTYVNDLAAALVQMCRHRPGGIYHAAGSERLSRFELLRLLAERLGFDRELIQPGLCRKNGKGGVQPGDLSLVCSRRRPLESIELRGASGVLTNWHRDIYNETSYSELQDRTAESERSSPAFVQS